MTFEIIYFSHSENSGSGIGMAKGTLKLNDSEIARWSAECSVYYLFTQICTKG